MAEKELRIRSPSACRLLCPRGHAGGGRPMGILRKIRDVVSARINDALENAEDPETRLDQMTRELSRSLVEMRKTAASAIATGRLTQGKLDRALDEVKAWEENAREAVGRKDDELARKALARKIALERSASGLASQVKEAGALADKMKDLLSSMEAKVREVKAKRDLVVSKRRAGDATRAMHEAVAGLEGRMSETRRAARGLLEGYDRFSEFEESVERLAAEVEALGELSGADLAREFEKMKEDKALEEELAALKKKLGGE